ncbi:RAMP superfamily CRISPR-associated protein [Nodularia sp. UHCC 0506]|uniref:RAMP superfamily CRISPR-associated protein n=1 Tax=Nodularia sp. UHCC 0506 TaxID=3110243 RepID=UPI002B1F5CE5|nr:RAMP superfamily CRISPR-associated protein [Nodularia sp. UHCC 0506]MEA5515828.1 RAMP superfamily CRISPR-associated protein [Nodularia sp. UHCC 0506]
MVCKRIKNRNQRKIYKRIIIRGLLVLYTPTCLGGGDTDGNIDLQILRDSIEDKALLMGSSIAGVLRNYLRKYQNRDEFLLFGGLRTDENSDQSPLIINDAISSELIKAELRDGVKIDSITRTAESQGKYDTEFLEAGTEFPLCFELLIEEKPDTPNYESSLLKGLAIALQGLENGEISLGMKKHRGFGRCHIKEWQVWNFNLKDASDRIAWLTFDHSWLTKPPCTKSADPKTSIVEAMKEAGLKFPEEWDDKREFCKIDATFTLASPLLIRSGQASSDKAPDVVHLKSWRNGELKPVLSGTSLAGVLRHRAERIINTIGKNTSIIENIFGSDLYKNKTSEAKASRLIVHESVIENTTDLVQNRIAIDRFTGGTLHGALFNEQPIFPKDNAHLKLNLELRNPQNHEIGLLLLLIKDLWTGDLPVGGASSIGRGRLQGKKATITLRRKQENTEFENITFTIEQSSPKETLVISDVKYLENFVSELNNEVNK